MLGLIPMRNTITLYLFSMRIIPYSFASYLGPLQLLYCVVLYDTSYQPIQYPIPKNHFVLQAMNTPITCIYIPDQLDISSLLFSAKIFFRSSFSISFPFRRIYQHQQWRHSHDTQSKACQSNTNTLGHTHFDMDHHHQMFGVLPNSILQ